MVMAIIAVLAAIAVPRMGASTFRYRLDRAAWRIAADMAYAQTLARRASRAQAVRFDMGAENYTLQTVPGLDDPTTDYTVDLSGGGAGVNLVSVQFENTNAYVSTSVFSFDMWGTPQCGDPNSGNPLAALVSGSIVIQLGSETRTITVDPVTGRASMP